jgi:hypothetical protein
LVALQDDGEDVVAVHSDRPVRFGLPDFAVELVGVQYPDPVCSIGGADGREDVNESGRVVDGGSLGGVSVSLGELEK